MARAPKKSTAVATRRSEILAVAAQVIADQGIKGATVRDIGQAAGILSGSLYYHFESKEQIVLELLLPSVQEQYERAVELRAASATATEALTALIRTSVRSTASYPRESVILRNEARTFREVEALAPVAELRSRMLALWIDVVKTGIRSGEFRADIDADFVVRAMFDGVLGASRWFGGQRRPRPDRVADSLVKLYVLGLTSDPT